MLVCAAPRGGTGSLLVGQPPAMHRAQGTLGKCNSRAEYIKGRTRMEITIAYFGFRNNAPSPKSNVFDQTGGQQCGAKYKII